MALLTLAPQHPDGTEPVAGGIRVWFEPPRHGWLFPHVELLECGEFICRASDVENDFLGDLVQALGGIFNEGRPTKAEAFGEPQSFDFRFARPEDGDIRCDIVTYSRFDEPLVEHPILTITASGDGVCRAFCFGIRELQRAISAETYAEGYSHPFPTEGLTALCAALGGGLPTASSRLPRGRPSLHMFLVELRGGSSKGVEYGFSFHQIGALGFHEPAVIGQAFPAQCTDFCGICPGPDQPEGTCGGSAVQHPLASLDHLPQWFGVGQPVVSADFDQLFSLAKKAAAFYNLPLHAQLCDFLAENSCFSSSLTSPSVGSGSCRFQVRSRFSLMPSALCRLGHRIPLFGDQADRLLLELGTVSSSLFRHVLLPPRAVYALN